MRFALTNLHHIIYTALDWKTNMKQKLIEAISVVLLLCVICILEQLPTTLGTGKQFPNVSYVFQIDIILKSEFLHT